MQLKKKVTTADLIKKSSMKKFKKIDADYVALYKALCRDFFAEVVQELMNGMIYKMPMRLGFLKVAQKSTRKSSIDWQLSKQYNKKIYFNNYHTNGKIYAFVWSKLNTYTILQTKYSYLFKATRTNNRALSALLKSEHRDYTVWNSSQ
ncbi:MAG TPA: hypothetical protein PKD00_09925 [Burkholderiales bacterium]|nr:hypothetical protein [Burkholderiales bacterium]